MSPTVRPRYSVSTAASAPASRSLMSSMTAALRWICALDASAFVGMWFHLFRRARGPLPLPGRGSGVTGGLRRSIEGGRIAGPSTLAPVSESEHLGPGTDRFGPTPRVRAVLIALDALAADRSWPELEIGRAHV